MRIKFRNKLLRRKSKLKMASFSNDRVHKVNPSSKKSRDVSKEMEKGSITGVPATSSVRSSSSSSQGSSKGKNRKGSINDKMNSGIQQIESYKSVTIKEVNVNPYNATVPTPIMQSLIRNCGAFSISGYNPMMLQNLGSPLYYPYPHFQLNNYSTNFLYRSDTITTRSNNNTDAEQDRKLLAQWRTWQRTDSGRKFKKLEDNSSVYTFTVMSYNVLAQDLVSSHSYLYKYHKPNALPWEQRWKNLLFEIRQHNADILCLQEVQNTHLETYYSQLKSLGYDGIYKQRTGNTTTDGCAIYYKTANLNLVNYTTVEYNQPNIFVLNRDNVAIIAKFSPKRDLENEFVVATTHLLYNPRREDVRLAQTQVLLTEIDRMAFKRNINKSTHLPIIITGDFNFVPNTPVYTLITKGELKYENLSNRSLQSLNTNSSKEVSTGKQFLPASLGITDQCQHADLVHQRNKYKTVEDLEHVYLYHSERSGKYNDSKKFDQALFSSGVLSHHLAIKSVFNHRRGNDIEATTFQNKWITVDYIFYSGMKDTNGLIIEDKLNLLSRYTIPTSQQLQGVSIPNMAVGSDHFSLIAKFKLNP